MIAIPNQPQKMTIEEYLAWEPEEDIRYEYVYGELLAMTGVTIPHNVITLNFYSALRLHLRSRKCMAYVSDVKLQVSPQNIYYYPDIIVSCNPEDINARKFIQNPILIAEVLSPSTSSKDRGEKFLHYLKIPTLQEYILIDSEKIFVERYCRGEGRMWLYHPYTDGDAYRKVGEAIALSSIDFELPVELLYQDVVF